MFLRREKIEGYVDVDPDRSGFVKDNNPIYTERRGMVRHTVPNSLVQYMEEFEKWRRKA